MPNDEEPEVDPLAQPGNVVERFIAPLTLAAQEEYARERLFAELGWDPERLGGDLGAALSSLVDVAEDLIALVEDPPDTLDEFGDAIDDVGRLITVIRDIEQAVDDGVELPDPDVLAELGRDLLSYLIVNYLRSNHPGLAQLAVLLAVVRPPDDPEALVTAPVVDPSTNEVLRHPTTRPTFDFGRIPDLLADPERVLKEEYLSDGSQTAVRDGLRRLVPRLADLFGVLGVDALYSTQPVSSDLPADVQAAVAGYEEVCSLRLTHTIEIEDADLEIGTEVVVYVGADGGVKLAVLPFGEAAIEHLTGSWALVLTLSGEAGSFTVDAGGVEFFDVDAARLGVEGTARKIPDPETGTAVTLGGEESTRLELGTLGFAAEADLRTSEQTYRIASRTTESAFVLSPNDVDGFLRNVLPEDDLRTEFDLGIGWASDRGLYLEGAAGLEATLPVHLSIGDVLSIDAVDLAVRARPEERAVPVYVTATAGVSLGPIEAVVERVGLSATLRFPEGGDGNLGPVDVELGFKPPSGAGLSIDAAAVTGGGYLFFDPDRGRYAGTLQLGFQNLLLTAVGILTTRMPDGSEGFSLLIIITGEFPPIQLGYGFTLNGVGGLLGVNRTAALEPLRSGIRTGTLGSVLFPRDPIRNAPQIISDLTTVFPPAANRFIIGPMAKLGWGTPTLLVAELGIALELPAPIRLIIMGRLSTILPAEEAELIRLRMDALGTIDFDKGDASIDATLFDSRFVQFAASGDMAMRANWGAAPTFALSAGGFNPRFQPPPGFPSLRRLTISLATGDNPRLRLETYLAVTSNTFQVGAKLDLYASAAGFSIEGVLGFDTLFQFSPFSFVADLVAGVALKKGSRELLSVRLELTFSGPQPWHARGKAKVKILFLSVSVPVNVRIGSDERPPLPEGDPLGEFRAALSDPRNWSAQVPEGGRTLVSLRERPDGEPPEDAPVLVHPLSDLTVRQRVVPLGIEIQKYGNTTPRTGRRFDITGARLRDRTVPVTPVAGKFAAAKFFEYTDEEKLTRPSFEDFPTGATIGTAGVEHRGGITTTLDYETEVIDDQRDPDVTVELDYTLPSGRFDALAELSAVAGSSMRTTGRLSFEGPSMVVALRETRYAVATTDTLAPQADIAVDTSYAAARTALTRRLLAEPAAGAALQVVSEHAITMEEP